MLKSEAAVAVVAAINGAFANEPALPRGELVVEGTWETRDIIRSLAEVNDMPNREFVERHFNSLPAFTSAGLRHVLPQYLIYSVENPRSEVTERVIFHLSPNDVESPYWRERLDAFSAEQRQAICEYLRYMQSELAGEHYDADLARAIAVWGCD